jgi:hypothetical protein
MEYELQFALLFTASLLILGVIGVIALLRNHPHLGRARVVIPFVAAFGAILAAVNEVVLGDGIMAAPRATLVATIAGAGWGTLSGQSLPPSRGSQFGEGPEVLSNKRLELTAPLGGRAGNGVVDAAASRSPFGERRRRSSSAVLGGRTQHRSSAA